MSPVFVCTVLIFFISWFISGAALSKNLNGFDLSKSDVPLARIEQGGPPRDGIPALDSPMFVTAANSGWLKPNDRILGYVQQGVAKAYPIAILNWHELVNDEVAGDGVLVSYCPLCGSGMAFAAEVAGQRLSFGVSGLLYNSDVLFYDRSTLSLWSQIDQVAISGPLRRTKLVQLPLTHTTWQRWRAKHPGTRVLASDQGYARDYSDDPYAGYAKSSRLFFKVTNKASRRYHAKELVLGLRSGDETMALPFVELRTQGLAEFPLKFGGDTITILWDEASNTATASDAQGQPVVHTVAYWFAWFAFHPNTEVFKQDTQNPQ